MRERERERRERERERKSKCSQDHYVLVSVHIVVVT